jgi:large subunit ribosomal protein L16
LKPYARTSTSPTLTPRPLMAASGSRSGSAAAPTRGIHKPDDSEAKEPRESSEGSKQRRRKTMLQPKRVKYRRPHSLRYEGHAKGGLSVDFGEYGLVALEGATTSPITKSKPPVLCSPVTPTGLAKSGSESSRRWRKPRSRPKSVWAAAKAIPEGWVAVVKKGKFSSKSAASRGQDERSPQDGWITNFRFGPRSSREPRLSLKLKSSRWKLSTNPPSMRNQGRGCRTA